MAKQVFSGCTLICGPHEIASDVNRFAFDQFAETLESTNFGSAGWRTVVGGRKHLDAMFEGFVPDDGGTQFADLRDFGNNSDDFPLIVTDTAPGSAAAGDDAVLCEKALITDYVDGGTVNQIAAFTCTLKSEGLGGYGQYGGTLTGATSSGTTTPINLGAVAAGQKVLSILSVSSAATGTLDVVLESDDGVGFASGTTRVTHTQVTTTATAEALTADGAITDTWWRFNYTIGASGTYTFRVALAIVTP